MVVTLRSGKELDETQEQKKIPEAETEKGEFEIEENVGAKTEVNNEGEKHKSDEVVPCNDPHQIIQVCNTFTKLTKLTRYD